METLQVSSHLWFWNTEGTMHSEKGKREPASLARVALCALKSLSTERQKENEKKTQMKNPLLFFQRVKINVHFSFFDCFLSFVLLFLFIRLTLLFIYIPFFNNVTYIALPLVDITAKAGFNLSVPNCKLFLRAFCLVGQSTSL